MLDLIEKVSSLLGPYERRRAGVVLFFIILMALVETLGVASIMPFLAVVGSPGIVETNTYLARLYDGLGFRSSQAFLAFLGGVAFVVLIFSMLLSAVSRWLILRFVHMCNYRLSTRLLHTYLKQPYEWFLDRHSADLGKQVLAETGRLVNQAIMPLMELIARSASTLFLLVLILLVDPLVALSAALALSFVYAIIFLTVRQRLTRLGAALNRSNTERYRIAGESLGGIKDVKVSGLEHRYAARFNAPARRYAREQASHQIIAEVPRYLLEALAFGGMIAIVVFLLLSREGGLGNVLPLIGLYALAGYRLLPAAQQIYRSLATLRFAGPILDKLHADLARSAMDGPSSRATGDVDVLPMAMDRSLDLDNVNFSYQGGGRPALTGISLRIPANTTVGFVGSTGAGKTTIVDLILGLLQPTSGSLLVDGIRITPENVRSWQRAIGYVPQHIFLTDDSVAANIAFGCTPDEIDLQAVQRAARLANLHDFVSSELPDGYQTHVGERGVRLSGGQRQRIGIARALYHDPRILVLDEATSALDNITERAVMDAVHNLGHRKTILMIAHRLSTVRECDQIFVLEQGRLIATGSYDQLTRESEVFRQMAAQAGVQ